MAFVAKPQSIVVAMLVFYVFYLNLEFTPFYTNYVTYVWCGMWLAVSYTAVIYCYLVFYPGSDTGVSHQMTMAVLYGVWPAILLGGVAAWFYLSIRMRNVAKFRDPNIDFSKLKKIHRFSSKQEVMLLSRAMRKFDEDGVMDPEAADLGELILKAGPWRRVVGGWLEGGWRVVGGALWRRLSALCSSINLNPRPLLTLSSLLRALGRTRDVSEGHRDLDPIRDVQHGGPQGRFAGGAGRLMASPRTVKTLRSENLKIWNLKPEGRPGEQGAADHRRQEPPQLHRALPALLLYRSRRAAQAAELRPGHGHACLRRVPVAIQVSCRCFCCHFAGEGSMPHQIIPLLTTAHHLQPPPTTSNHQVGHPRASRDSQQNPGPLALDAQERPPGWQGRSGGVSAERHRRPDPPHLPQVRDIVVGCFMV